MTDPINTTDNINEILISGSDYMAARADFVFAGREKELTGLQEILMQKGNNCVILTGASGVGMTALVMGLQKSKDVPGAPPKLLNKNMFFLDTDKLFESGDARQINSSFRVIREKLSLTPGSVLYVENMGNFIESCTKCGCANLMNGLIGDVKKGKYQTILEAPYEELAKVIKYNSEMKASYTMRDLKEPKDKELDAIVAAAIPPLVKHHGISVSKEAIALATKLATKHRTGVLQAMPMGIVTLIDRALSSYALKAHLQPFQLQMLTERLKHLDAALSGEVSSDLSPADLTERKKSTETEIATFKGAWDKRQTELQSAYKRQQVAEQRITKLEAQIATFRLQDQKDGNSLGLSDAEVKAEEDLVIAREALRKNTEGLDRITAEVNKELQLGEVHILDTFSEITNIPLQKLTQTEREKIVGLEDKLNNDVFDQEHAVRKVYNAVKNAATGQAEEGKPKGNFLFLGPSGVGKTELIKRVAKHLFDDPNSTIRIDMSEYMEKNAANKLIGPPPGYVGFEEGGYLTEAMQKKPIRIVHVDEIEKGHPDVLNLFLQALDDGRLTDGKGVTVSFEDCYFFFTSNIGQNNFPNRQINYEEAMAKSIVELKEAGVRNELLNRFAGKRNIVGFFPLEPHTMERIVVRHLQETNARIAKTGLSFNITPEDLTSIAHDLYSPSNGARSVPGFFADEVKPQASDILLDTPDASGVICLKYNPEKRVMDLVSYEKSSTPAPTPTPPAPSGVRAQMSRAAGMTPEPR